MIKKKEFGEFIQSIGVVICVGALMSLDTVHILDMYKINAEIDKATLISIGGVSIFFIGLLIEGPNRLPVGWLYKTAKKLVFFFKPLLIGLIGGTIIKAIGTDNFLTVQALKFPVSIIVGAALLKIMLIKYTSSYENEYPEKFI